MPFIKTLVGGIAIVVIATAVGIVQNAFREPSLPLKPGPRNPDRSTSAESPGDASTALPGSDRVDPSEVVPDRVAAGSVPEGTLTPEEVAKGEIAKERLREILAGSGVVVIDARASHEFTEGHLPGAINLPYENFVERYDELIAEVPTDAVVIVYCRSLTCDLSDQLAEELHIAGYQNVLLYKGGWEEWTEAGFPTE